MLTIKKLLEEVLSLQSDPKLDKEKNFPGGYKDSDARIAR
jgi:hypothetical protein